VKWEVTIAFSSQDYQDTVPDFIDLHYVENVNYYITKWAI